MNQDLIALQKHLTEANFKVQELEDEVCGAQGARYRAEDSLHYTKIRYRVAIGIFVVLTIGMGYTNMRYAAENRWFANELKQKKDLQHRFNNILKELHYQNSRVLELQNANEQLIRFCQPCDVKRAVRATPLPSLVKGA